MKQGAHLAAEDLDKPNWGNLESNLDFLLKTGLLRKPAKILEVGSGKGNLTAHLREAGHEITGIDVELAVVRESKRIRPILPVVVGGGEILPFGPSVFDIVVSFDVFEHIPDSDTHLAEVRRVLKPGGYYLLQTPNKWTNVIFEPIRHSRKYGIKKAFKFLEYPGHCALHNYWQLKHRFRKNGFEPVYYQIPVVNNFFRDKMSRFLGRAGLLILRLINPDRLPLPFRTNFFVEAKKLDSP